MMIHEKIIAVMRDTVAIPKDRTNSKQGYSFRGIDDVYASLHDILAKHGVFTMPEVLAERMEERESKNGGALIYRILTIKYHFYAEDGSSVESVVIGEGQDSGDKASNKAMSVAHKYALLQAFAIPTDDAKDPENESHEVVPKNVESSPIKDECGKLSTELGLTDSEKATLWKASGQNFSNLVILLRKKRDDLNSAFNGIVETSKAIDEIVKDAK